MKSTRRLLVTLLIFTIGILSVALLIFTTGVLSAAKRSDHFGKQVRASRVFERRNPLRQSPQLDFQPDAPLLISRPRYYSFMSIGSGVGGVLRFDITNRSNKRVHSYDCRYYSPVLIGNGAYGSHPEEGLLPGQSRVDSVSANEYAPLTLAIDFVQFQDGTTWFSNSPHSTVKPEGLEAGAKAAASYLREVMSRDGVGSVMASLPRIHADVREPDGAATNLEFGIFGFSCGVTNTAVRVNHEYEDGGAERVERFLRSYQK